MQNLCMYIYIISIKISGSIILYCIAGNFCSVQFPQMVNLYHFAGLIFVDACTCARYVLYKLISRVQFSQMHALMPVMYCTIELISRVQFSRIVDLYHFVNLIFADTCICAHNHYISMYCTIKLVLRV